MGGGIYLIQDNDQLVEMTEQAYESEESLQELLVKYPNLLAADRTGSNTASQWLLISREVTVPVEDNGTGSWSLDRLFLDQDATPTLVEVKSDNDTYARRATIGQMFDYAANLLVYWPVEAILAQFEANCKELGRDPEQVFEAFLGSDADEEKFWQKVKTNLQAGKIRLVFVSDDLGDELRRVIEFLNAKMDPVEVLGVEIKQYVSQDGLRTLVPRLIGKTAEAQQRKNSTTPERRRWDKTSFFHEYEVRQGFEEAQTVKKIYEWAQGKQPLVEVQWGTGDTYGGFAVWIRPKNSEPQELFSIGIHGGLQINSSHYTALPVFATEEKWLELRNHLSDIGLSLPVDPQERRLPSFQLSTMQDDLALKRVIETFSWVVNQL